jgi:hypothetical protein
VVTHEFREELPQLRMALGEQREHGDVLAGVVTGHRGAERQAVRAQIALGDHALAQVGQHVAQVDVNLDQLISVRQQAGVLPGSIHEGPMVRRLHARGGLRAGRTATLPRSDQVPPPRSSRQPARSSARAPHAGP